MTLKPLFFLVSWFYLTNAAVNTPISILRASKIIVWCISSHTVFFNHILSKSTALYTFSHVIELSESRLFSTFSWNSPHIKILFDTDCSLELKILLILGPFFEKIWKLTVAAQYYVCWNSMRSGKSDVCIENSHEVFVVLCFS